MKENKEARAGGYGFERLKMNRPHFHRIGWRRGWTWKSEMGRKGRNLCLRASL